MLVLFEATSLWSFIRTAIADSTVYFLCMFSCVTELAALFHGHSHRIKWPAWGPEFALCPFFPVCPILVITPYSQP